MRAGVSEGIINPLFPSLLYGYPLPKDRYHTTIHDDLMVHCFYFQNNDAELGIITLDLCAMSKKRCRDLREAVEKASGIPRNNIAVCCTHTHSGPVTTSIDPRWNDDYEEYSDYVDSVVRIAVKKIAEAKETSFEAMISAGKGICGAKQGVGGNRRDKDGPADPEVFCLGIHDSTGTLRGAIVNYALHPTFLHAESREISADYPAYIYNYFKSKSPDIIVGFTIGAAGNQSSRHFRTSQSFDEARRAGETIAAEASSVLATSPRLTEPMLTVSSFDFTPPLTEIPTLAAATADEAEARRAYEEARDAGEAYPYVRTLECTLIGAEHRLNFARSGPDNKAVAAWASPFEAQIMGFGDVHLVFWPGEHFVEYALQLKQESPYPLTVLSTCANGAACGYICTPEAHAEGGYESLWTRYRPETGARLVDATLKTLEGLRKGEDR